MVISAAGAVDHDALVKAAGKAFAKLPSGGKSAADLVKEVRGVRAWAVQGCAGWADARGRSRGLVWPRFAGAACRSCLELPQ